MASSSRVMVGVPFSPASNYCYSIDYEDLETSKLIAQLALEDIADIGGRRKGKGRADAGPSNEEAAFRYQLEYWQNVIQIIDDCILANSIQRAVAADRTCLDVLDTIEKAAADDHAAALALEQGQPLPALTASQLALEKKDFLEPLNDTSPGSSKWASSHPGVYGSRNIKIQCIICNDTIRGASLHNSCNHDYCEDCVVSLVEACLKDETLYPPRCCHRPFDPQEVLKFLEPKLKQTFNAKRRELDVPMAHRVYCPFPDCSRFLGSSEAAQADMLCSGCTVLICPRCRQMAHPGDTCSENIESTAVRELAIQMRWQTCPECSAVVELNQGCFHVTCRCRAQFCYLCASPWKTCKCPQWDENRIIYTAEQRVQRLNPQEQVNSRAMQERVNAMVNHLRKNVDCTSHSWDAHSASGQCEMCHTTMPQYIYTCRTCRVMACRRCAQNRA